MSRLVATMHQSDYWIHSEFRKTSETFIREPPVQTVGLTIKGPFPRDGIANCVQTKVNQKV